MCLPSRYPHEAGLTILGETQIIDTRQYPAKGITYLAWPTEATGHQVESHHPGLQMMLVYKLRDITSLIHDNGDGDVVLTVIDELLTEAAQNAPYTDLIKGKLKAIFQQLLDRHETAGIPSLSGATLDKIAITALQLDFHEEFQRAALSIVDANYGANPTPRPITSTLGFLLSETNDAENTTFWISLHRGRAKAKAFDIIRSAYTDAQIARARIYSGKELLHYPEIYGTDYIPEPRLNIDDWRKSVFD